MKENEELKTKNGKLEKHLDSLKVQVSDLKTELLELKFRKNNKMSKVKDETEKYKEYFKSQIEALRNEMISKKNNMDKMKLLLDEYKNKIIELEKELSEINQRWDKKWEEERNKEKLYILEIENKLGKEISQLRKEKSKKAQQLSDMRYFHELNILVLSMTNFLQKQKLKGIILLIFYSQYKKNLIALINGIKITRNYMQIFLLNLAKKKIALNYLLMLLII